MKLLKHFPILLVAPRSARSAVANKHCQSCRTFSLTLSSSELDYTPTRLSASQGRMQQGVMQNATVQTERCSQSMMSFVWRASLSTQTGACHEMYGLPHTNYTAHNNSVSVIQRPQEQQQAGRGRKQRRLEAPSPQSCLVSRLHRHLNAAFSHSSPGGFTGPGRRQR